MLARASITHTGFNCAKKIRLEASGGFEKGLPKKAHCGCVNKKYAHRYQIHAVFSIIVRPILTSERNVGRVGRVGR